MTIELIERGKKIPHNLEIQDYNFLALNHSSHLKLTQKTISAKNVAGLIECPSGVKIRIAPKVPINNLLYIIAHTYDVVRFYNYNDLKNETKIKSPLTIYVMVLLNWVEILFKKGLIKSYQTKTIESPIIRGRLIDSSKFKINGKFVCEVGDNSHSCIENQLLKAVLLFLKKHIDILELSDLKPQINSYVWLLHDVPNIEMSNIQFKNIKFNRLNKNYKKIIHLCSLIHSGSFLCDEIDGTIVFSGFLVNMEQVFEKFIYKILESKFNDAGVEYQYRYDDFLITDLDGITKTSQAIPDIIIPGKLVVEVKYYNDVITNDKNYDRYHLVQLHNNCVALKLNGLLIYPDNGVGFKFNKIERTTNHPKKLKIASATFPINSPLPTFEKNIEEFIKNISVLFPVNRKKN